MIYLGNPSPFIVIVSWSTSSGHSPFEFFHLIFNTAYIYHVLMSLSIFYGQILWSFDAIQIKPQHRNAMKKHRMNQLHCMFRCVVMPLQNPTSSFRAAAWQHRRRCNLTFLVWWPHFPPLFAWFGLGVLMFGRTITPKLSQFLPNLLLWLGFLKSTSLNLLNHTN